MSLVVLITGAASGIGKATALKVAAPGRSLGLMTRSNAQGLDDVAREITSMGATVATYVGDLTQPGTAGSFVATMRDRLGPIDQIVSNAGHAQKKSVADLTHGDLDSAAALNTKPFLDLVQAASLDLKASAQGRVVAISSFVTHQFGINDKLFPATAASKAALVALAKSLAFELAPTGTTVNCVSPGYTEKESKHGTLDPAAWERAAAAAPNGRLAKPVDIAAAAAFLLSEGAAHITGQVLNVDGGLSLR